MWLLISTEPMLQLKKFQERLGVSWHTCSKKEKKVTMMIFILLLKEETMEQIENTKSVILAVKDYLSKMEN